MIQVVKASRALASCITSSTSADEAKRIRDAVERQRLIAELQGDTDSAASIQKILDNLDKRLRWMSK